jgi:ABC-type multidrug transport system ATPase subunit
MTIALQVRGLRKRYIAGVGSCAASIDVLRGVELTVCAGEAIGIAGPAGAGKSTLLLCLAGLLGPDAGEIAWFDVRERAAAARYVVHHATRLDLLRAGCSTERHLHLVDVPRGDDDRVDAWIAARREHGDAVVVASRDLGPIGCLDRVCTLQRGVLRPVMALTTRVAEAVMR